MPMSPDFKSVPEMPENERAVIRTFVARDQAGAQRCPEQLLLQSDLQSLRFGGKVLDWKLARLKRLREQAEDPELQAAIACKHATMLGYRSHPAPRCSRPGPASISVLRARYAGVVAAVLRRAPTQAGPESPIKSPGHPAQDTESQPPGEVQGCPTPPDSPLGTPSHLPGPGVTYGEAEHVRPGDTPPRSPTAAPRPESPPPAASAGRQPSGRRQKKDSEGHRYLGHDLNISFSDEVRYIWCCSRVQFPG